MGSYLFTAGIHCLFGSPKAHRRSWPSSKDDEKPRLGQSQEDGTAPLLLSGAIDLQAHTVGQEAGVIPAAPLGGATGQYAPTNTKRHQPIDNRHRPSRCLITFLSYYVI